MIAITIKGKPNNNAHGDVAVVLGAAVSDDIPSPVFAARIDHAIELYKRGNVEKIIFTGGTGEGEAGKRYAVDRGVPDDKILVESISKSTKENLEGAQQIMHENNLRTAVIVSDPQHLFRANMLADRIGFSHVCSPTPTSRYTGFFAKTKQLFRETYYVSRLVLTGQ